MTTSREERLARVRAEMQRRLERRREERKRKRFLPPPRYDDVYFEGLACLDRLAGEPIPLGPVAVTLNPVKEETMKHSQAVQASAEPIEPGPITVPALPEESPVKPHGMIDVRDRLPQAGSVLVFVDKVFDFDIGIYSNGHWRTRTFGRLLDVTHWAPLPPGPGIRREAVRKYIQKYRARLAQKRSSPPYHPPWRACDNHSSSS